MAFTKMNVNVNNIQALSDLPNTTDGLTSAELKERFDKAGSDLKNYLNATLTEELDDAFVNVNTTMEQILTQSRNAEYPIGRVVIFYDNADHSSYLGFTWERCLTGKVPVGIDTNDTDFNTIGKTGGEKKHTLTVNEMPSHGHNLQFHDGAGSSVDSGKGVPYLGNGNRYTGGDPRGIQPTGGSQAHNIMQPYEVVSFWRRVS